MINHGCRIDEAPISSNKIYYYRQDIFFILICNKVAEKNDDNELISIQDFYKNE